MNRRVVVQHLVAKLTTRQYGPGQRVSNLLDVNYWREVPADTEFPRVFGRLDLCTRFYLKRAQSSSSRITPLLNLESRPV